MSEQARRHHNGGSSTRGRLWDAVVVGGGPAGSTAAFYLTAHGHDVLILDKYDFPRPKVCGDALIPDALASLKRSGLYDAVRAHAYHASTVSVYSPSRIQVDLPGEFLTIKREVFDSILLDAAVARGAEFRRGEVVDVERGPEEVRLVTRDETITARYGILATGADVSLLKSTEMLRRRRPSGIAARFYVRSTVQIDELVVSLDRAVLPGYAWIFPLPDGLYNVGAGGFYHGRKNRGLRLRKVVDAFLESFPAAQALMDAATDVTPLQGAMLRCGLEGAAVVDGGRVVAVGETIGTTFPFTGEGIGKAMESAELAALRVHEALTTDNPAPLDQLPTMLERDLRHRYLGYQVAESWASHAWLTDMLARRIQASPRLTRAAAGVLNEHVDPRVVFRWRNLLPRWARGQLRHSENP